MDPTKSGSTNASTQPPATARGYGWLLVGLGLWPIALVLLGLSFLAGPLYGFLLQKLVRSSLLLLLFELVGAAYLWYAGAAIALFCGALLLLPRPLRWKSMFVLGISLGLYASSILYWYVPRPQVANAGGTSLTVMAYNVNYRLWDTDEVTAIARAHPADILGLIEPLTEDAAELYDNVRDLYPHYYRAPTGSLSLFSRYPIESATADNLGTETYSLLAVLNIDDRPIRLVVVHPPPPVSRSLLVNRNQTIAALADYARQQSEPTIVMGDFNTASWSPYLRNFMRRSGLRNASLGQGIHPTWCYADTGRSHSWRAQLAQALKVPIDHLFVSPDIRVDRLETAPAGVSDHRPVIAKLKLPAP